MTAIAFFIVMLAASWAVSRFIGDRLASRTADYPVVHADVRQPRESRVAGSGPIEERYGSSHVRRLLNEKSDEDVEAIIADIYGRPRRQR